MQIPKVAVEPRGGSGAAGARGWFGTSRAAGAHWEPVRAVPRVTHSSRKRFPAICGSVPAVDGGELLAGSRGLFGDPLY